MSETKRRAAVSFAWRCVSSVHAERISSAMRALRLVPFELLLVLCRVPLPQHLELLIGGDELPLELGRVAARATLTQPVVLLV